MEDLLKFQKITYKIQSENLVKLKFQNGKSYKISKGKIL